MPPLICTDGRSPVTGGLETLRKKSTLLLRDDIERISHRLLHVSGFLGRTSFPALRRFRSPAAPYQNTVAPSGERMHRSMLPTFFVLNPHTRDYTIAAIAQAKIDTRNPRLFFTPLASNHLQINSAITVPTAAPTAPILGTSAIFSVILNTAAIPAIVADSRS